MGAQAKATAAANGSEDDKAKGPDIAEVMAEIRARVRADVEANRDRQKSYKPINADFSTAQRAGAMLHSEELRYLNTNYAFGPKLNLDSITSHRRGLIGRGIVKVKRKLLVVVWNLLKDYFTAERDFHANLVRFLNDFTKYVDARDAANFWEVIRKIDYDVTKALERIERIGDEQMASLRASERRVLDEVYAGLKDLQGHVTRLDAARAQHDDRLQTLDNVAHGLERIVAGLKSPAHMPAASTEAADASSFPDFSYLLLENRFRGSETEIARRLSVYPSIFQNAPGTVLDIGPGRGELLGLFKQAGIAAYGVDIDPAMAQEAGSRGFDVRVGDGLAHLRSLPDRSLGGVIAVQVVEHLPRRALEELLRLCAVKVKKGGKVVFETINPRSMLALSSHFFRDPTHVWPVHPDTLAYAMTLAGLEVEELRDLTPVPQEGQLRPVPVEDYMTPRWAYTVELLNRNMQQLNSLLYGFQDYCAVARAV